METANKLARRWLNSNLLGWANGEGNMFEKYDAFNPGEYGGGGEYEPQSGFGWTNGVALELIERNYAVGGSTLA
jgi:alpha,alpha-trehalase